MFGVLGLGSVSTGYQRTIVEAHGKKWVLCLVLEATDDEHDQLADRFALAVPCNSDDFPVPVQLIQFTPPDVKEKRERNTACKAAGHPLGDDELRVARDRLGKRCACGENTSSRAATTEEIRDWEARKGFFDAGTAFQIRKR